MSNTEACGIYESRCTCDCGQPHRIAIVPFNRLTLDLIRVDLQAPLQTQN